MAASTTIITTVAAAAEAEMEDSEVNKTSDEIINELFSSLNVPLSPKVVEVEERIIIKGEQVSAHTGDSDNSGDDESDSKSSESEGEAKTTGAEVQGNRTEKVKSQKKKKDKRKKKKKHRKKEDGGRHKHRKKKKKETFETAEEAKLAGDILQDVKLKNQALIQKIMIREEVPPGTVDGRKDEKSKSRSKSPKLLPTEDKVSGGNITKPRESQSPHKEVTASPSEGIIDLSPEICKDITCVPADGSVENVSKSEIQSCPTHERSPRSECGSKSTQMSPTVLGEHKRKQSPHSCSPSPVKKLKSCNSVSPSKSSSPKAGRERSRSRSVKNSKSESCRRTKSRSPAVKRSKSQSKRSRSRSRKRSTSKSRKKSESKLKKRSRSRSKKRSRSRSKSRRSRSRSRRRARSRSKKRSRSRSKKRSRSRSKSRRRSRSKSTKRSGSKSRRKSISKSKRSRSRDRSRSRSQRRSSSKSGKRSRSRLRRRSRSKSIKRSTSKSRRSRSRRKSRSQSQGRSRSKSSHKSSPAKERFDMFAVMRERANRLAELKNQGIPDGSLGSLLLSAAAVSVQCGGGSGVSQSVATSDPSSIPLPVQDVPLDDSPAKEEAVEESSVGVEEDKPVPVIEEHVTSSAQEQDATKAKEGTKTKHEEGNDKSKMKTIITIKSLKDSVVFQQAQEEAERKAKEKVDQPAGSKDSSAADSKVKQSQESTEGQEQEEANQAGEEKSSDKNDTGESEEESMDEENEEGKNEDRTQEEENQKEESSVKEMAVETEDEIMKKLIEKGSKDTEKNTHTKKIQEIDLEEIDIETKTSSRKRTVSKTEEREESKESKHSSKTEKEEKNRSKQASKDKENDRNEVLTESEDEDKGNKQSSRLEEKEGKKIKSSSKSDEANDNKRNMEIDKIEEEDKVDKPSSKAEEKEKEDIVNNLSTTIEEQEEGEEEEEEEEEERENEPSSKVEEKKEGKLSKPSNKIEEDKSKGRKSSSKVEEKEEGKKSKHSTKMEDKEESKGSKDVSGKNGHQHPEDDSEDKIEEGEITSDKEEVVTKPPTKTHSKKSKKDKSSGKEKKRSHKDKTKNKEEKKKAHDKKKEQEKTKSKDTHKSRQHSSSASKEHSHSRRRRKHTRSRSRSRDHSSRQHRRSHSRSRSKSRSKRRRESTSDLRDKVTRKRLLEIARRNAVYLMENGCLPPSVEKEQLVKIKAGGKSVDELTDFCKQLVASGNYSDVDVSEPSMSSEEENSTEKPFSSTRHPFSVRDSKPILMNIRNAPMLPTKTNAERLAGQAKLREQFPVSSGSQHRTKESEWVPVTPKEKKEEDKVFTKPEPPSVDISEIVSTRLSAMRKLQDNPNDSEAIKTLNNVQKEMQNWALSKQEPGQFTGTTGVKVLSQEELSSGHQAWARKEQFKEAAPVRPHFGLKMLQKMGWSPGEGLGKNKEGTTEPLLLDVKMDKKGFHAQEEVTPKKQPIPLVKDLSGKHPVSALVELCSKRKWSPPDFEMVFDCGPDHKKNFLMKVMVNGQEFKPSVAASTKKMAKANAAAAYLQSLGLYPKDPRYPL